MVTNKKLLIRTAILTTVVFAIGVVIGFSFDSLRSTSVLDNLQKSELDAQSFLVEQEFFNRLGTYDCTVAQSRLTQLSQQLGELGFYLVNFEEKNIFKQEEYDYLLRKYFLSEIRLYTLFTDLKETCDLSNPLILYFFSPQDSLSELQGKVLDVLVKKHPEVSVFSLNSNYQGELLLDNIKTYYTVTKTPTLIIDDTLKRDDFVDLEELEALISHSEA